MAVQYVTGASPVTFLSEETSADGPDAGIQYQIPLPLITYNTAVTPPVILTGWPQHAVIAASDVELAQTLIQNLINQGILTLSKTAAP